MNAPSPELEAAIRSVDPWALLTSLLADSPYPLQVYAPAGRSLYANDAFLRVFGSAPPPEYNVLEDAVLARTGLLEQMRRAFGGEAVELPPVWYNPAENGQVPVPDGRPVYLRLRAYPLRGGDGAVALVVFQFEDLTTQQTTLEEKERLLAERDAVLSQSPHGIIIVDANGRVVLFNDAARRIWSGAPQTESIAMWDQFRGFHADGTVLAPAEWPLARSLRDAETIEAEEIHVERFDGTRGTLLGGSAPLRDAQGQVTGAVAVFIDVTGSKELERLRDEFISVAAHELRTPLTTLLGYTQLLARRLQLGAPRERLEPSAANILRAGRRLDTLVNQLLDISRLERGTLALNRAACDLAAVARQVVEDMAFRSTVADTVLDAPPVLVGTWDVGRIEQVLTNLLDNALKYGRHGAPVILRLRDEPDAVTITVENEGAGLDEATIAHLFDRYYRADTHRGLDTPGLGLGLYLAREVAHAHGGRIHAANRPGGGLCVTLTLPRE